MSNAARERLDIVIPVYNEGANIVYDLRAIAREVKRPVGYDRLRRDGRRHLPAITENRESDFGGLAIEFVRNRGAAPTVPYSPDLQQAMRHSCSCIPADDDYNAAILDPMVAEAAKGCDIVCASRFMAGGSMVGCPWLKDVAGPRRKFHALSICAPADARRQQRLSPFFAPRHDEITIESDRGFCYSIELLVKCHRLGWQIGEVPARWFERAHGASRFR